jgi:hypothetical protein
MNWNPVARIAILVVAVRMVAGCGSGSGTRLSITTMSLSDGTVGTAYNEMVQATGGTAPYTWSVSAGSLPGGLDLGGGNALSVTISGTPNAAQNAATFTIKLTDSKNQTATQPFSMNIKNPPGPVISTTPAPPDATQTVPYAFTFTATGGLAPLTWSETGDLPAGLSFLAEAFCLASRQPLEASLSASR